MKRLWGAVLLLGAAMILLGGCVTVNDVVGEKQATINGVDVLSRTDEFSGHTTYSVVTTAKRGGFIYKYSTRGVYFIEYWRVSPQWLFPERVLWLVDGEMMETPIIDVNSRVVNSEMVEERIYIAMTKESLEAVSDAGIAKVSVRGTGADEWEIERKEQDAIDALLLYIDSL